MADARAALMAGAVVGKFAFARLAALQRIAQFRPACLPFVALRPGRRAGVSQQQPVAKARQQVTGCRAGRSDFKADDVNVRLAQQQAAGLRGALRALQGFGKFINIGLHGLAALGAVAGGDGAALAAQNAQRRQALQIRLRERQHSLDRKSVV